MTRHHAIAAATVIAVIAVAGAFLAYLEAKADHTTWPWNRLPLSS
ncbi:MAG: hypothetical protein Q8O56_13960 [Solirubrobacteraceae bacterium]|nr:hypothetical protein [Solirubrobacteraceae bacterium]